MLTRRKTHAEDRRPYKSIIDAWSFKNEDKDAAIEKKNEYNISEKKVRAQRKVALKKDYNIHANSQPQQCAKPSTWKSGGYLHELSSFR